MKDNSGCLSGAETFELESSQEIGEFGQGANLAPDWSFVFRQPIRRQFGSLTQLLKLTTTQKFPSLVVHEDGQRALVVLEDVLAGGAAAHHAARAPVIRHGEVGLHQAKEGRLA